MITGYASIPRSVLHDEKLSSGAKMVLLVLSSFAGAEDTAWPSHASIAALAGVSPRSVRRYLGELKAAKLIRWHQRKSASGDLKSNIYRLLDATGRGTANLTVGTDTVAGGADTVAEERTSMNVPQEKTSTSDAASGPDKQPSEEVLELCNRLADRIAANGCKRPTIGKTWHQAARLMITADGRTVDQIRKAIDWCQADEFWRSNVLSMPTLRKQYDRLRLAAQRAPVNGRPAPPTYKHTADKACSVPGHENYPAHNCAGCRTERNETRA